MRGPLSRFLPRPFWGLQGLLGPQLPPWQRVQRLCGVTAGSSGGDGLPPPRAGVWTHPSGPHLLAHIHALCHVAPPIRPP